VAQNGVHVVNCSCKISPQSNKKVDDSTRTIIPLNGNFVTLLSFCHTQMYHGSFSHPFSFLYSGFLCIPDPIIPCGRSGKHAS